jgi:ribosomal protein L11 methyltransferase
MPFLELHLRLQAPDQPATEVALENCGSLAITLLDAEDTPILEPGVGETPLWPDLHLTALFDEHRDRIEILAVLEDALPRQIVETARFAVLDDRDWTRAWMDHYHPMRFGRRLWIYPWTEATPDNPESVVVRLDPGLAFGTGTHPTTALCLEWLDSVDCGGMTVTDFGCGSGILAIAALKLGARQAYAIDNDPQALLATRENAERNAVASKLSVLGHTEPAPPEADILLANILLNPLIKLHESLTNAVRIGGLAVFSGMLAEQASEFITTYRHCFDPLKVTQREDWIRIEGIRIR